MTRCPLFIQLPYTPERMNAAARYYPLVGLVVGCVGAGVYLLAIDAFGVSLAVLLSTAATILFTGAFHEDGFADTCDGFGGQTRERTLEIMKDSRLGTYGTLGIGLLLAIKIIALTQIPPALVPCILVTTHGLSRLSSVVVIATSHYVRDEGTGKPTAAGLSSVSALIALSTGLIAIWGLMYFGSYRFAIASLIGLSLGHVTMRLVYQRKLGGYTGDCLGAVQQLSEVGGYLAILSIL